LGAAAVWAATEARPSARRAETVAISATSRVFIRHPPPVIERLSLMSPDHVPPANGAGVSIRLAPRGAPPRDPAVSTLDCELDQRIDLRLLMRELAVDDEHRHSVDGGPDETGELQRIVLPDGAIFLEQDDRVHECLKCGGRFPQQVLI